jgi:archaellum component FlaC
VSEINDLLDELVRSASTLHYVIDDNECPDKAFENLQKCKDAIISEITTLKQRITELESFIERLIEAGNVLAEYCDENSYCWEQEVEDAGESWQVLVAEREHRHDKPEATA